MRFMLVGDTHGHVDVIANKAVVARNLGCTTMIVVGDFGLWPGYEGVQFLDDVNAAVREHNQTLIALPGNHEDHDQWEKWFDLAPKDSHGFAIVRSHIRLTKKVHPFTMDGKRFYVAGGAVSIDKKWRKEGKSWWPNEELTEDQTCSIEQYNGPPVDYLLTHDCSDHTKWGFDLVPDPDSKIHRQRIDRVIRALKPRYHFHGHMHTRYHWVNTRSHGLRVTAFGADESEWNGHGTVTHGLECDNDMYSWMILDTGAQKEDRDRVFWPREAVNEFGPIVSR